MAQVALGTPTQPGTGGPDWTLAGAEVLPRSRLKSLQRRSDRPGLIHLAGHFGALVATGVVLFLTMGTLWAVPATLAHGFVMVLLFAPLHECTHGTAFRTRWLNQGVAWVCGAIILRPSLYFKYRHASHHTYTQHHAKDPDIVKMPRSTLEYLRLVLGFSFWPKLVGTLWRGATGRFNADERDFIPEVERPRVARETRVLVGLYSVVALVSVLTGSWAAVLYWLLPRFVAEPVLRMIRMAEHTGAAETPNLLENTRTTLTNPVLRFLYWNMPYHAEHHLATSVPFHALGAMHREIGPHLGVVATGYLAAHRELVGRIREARRGARRRVAA